MIKGNRILKKLGKENFCRWILKHGHKIKINLRGADLQEADLQEANLQEADLRGANLRGADLQEANLYFACWPLWCGSKDTEIDEKQAKQLCAHAMQVSQGFFPGLTSEQKEWLNDFHKIKTNEFPQFK